MLPAGPYLRVEGTGIVITLAGQRITGDLVLEKARSNGADVVRVGLRNVSAAFGDGTTDLVTLSEGVGLLVITGVSPGKAGGLAGTLSGRVRMNVPGVTLDATLTLAINTRPSTDGPVNEVLTFGDQPTTTTALVVGDVNGDGRADIVVGSADKLFLYLNDGSGDPYDAVPAIVLALPAGTVTALALGDLDGDNRPELVAGTTLATVLFRNDGAGLFTVDGTVDLGTGARAVVIGAVDAAAGADVLVASGTSLTRYSNLGTSSSTGLWQGVGAGSAVAGTWTATVGLRARRRQRRRQARPLRRFRCSRGGRPPPRRRRRHLRRGRRNGHVRVDLRRARRRRRQRHPRPRAHDGHRRQRGAQPGWHVDRLLRPRSPSWRRAPSSRSAPAGSTAAPRPTSCSSTAAARRVARRHRHRPAVRPVPDRHRHRRAVAHPGPRASTSW